MFGKLIISTDVRALLTQCRLQPSRLYNLCPRFHLLVRLRCLYFTMLMVHSGFCQSSRTCTDSGSCSVNDWMQTGYTCPTLDSVTPNRGTADGGTSVNILSSYLLNGVPISASDVQCEFVGVSTVPAQSVTYNSVTCVTPAISPSKLIPAARPHKILTRGNRNKSCSRREDQVSKWLLGTKQCHFQLLW